MRYVLVLVCFVLSGCAGVSRGHNAPISERVPILLYHHIQDLPEDAVRSLKRWSLSPELFTQHMDWILKQGYHPITMAQWNDHIKHGAALPSKPIIVTLDDGWKDHCMVVFPILQNKHIPASFFITTDSVGHSAFVTWDDLQKMADSGMDIQAHSLTHPHLNKIPEAEALREIVESKKALESHLQKPVKIFAYPYGSYTERIIDMVQKAGYESATIVNGRNIGIIYSADRTYTISRIAIEGGTTVDDLAKNINEMKNDHVSY